MKNNTSIVVIAIVSALTLFGAVIVTIPLQQQQAYAKATTFTINERIPVDFEDFVPCASDGEGEVVHLTGELHFSFHVTLDSAGGAHIKVHSNTEGLIGTGLTTGDKYQGKDLIHFNLNVKEGVQSTQISTFHIIGQGNANDFLAHVTLHITIHPDGTVTAEVFKRRIECK